VGSIFLGLAKKIVKQEHSRFPKYWDKTQNIGIKPNLKTRTFPIPVFKASTQPIYALHLKAYINNKEKK